MKKEQEKKKEKGGKYFKHPRVVLTIINKYWCLSTNFASRLSQIHKHSQAQFLQLSNRDIIIPF